MAVSHLRIGLYEYYKLGGFLSSRKVNAVFGSLLGKPEYDQISTYTEVPTESNAMSVIKCISDEHVLPRIPEPTVPHDLSYSPYGRWHMTRVINRYLESGTYLFFKDINENETTQKWHLHIPNGKIETGLYWEQRNGEWTGETYTSGDMFLYSQVPCTMITACEDSNLMCVTYEWFDQKLVDPGAESIRNEKEEYNIAVACID